MSESDGEIEYLDEDADIVQQCVQSVSLQVETPIQVAETPALVAEIKAEASENEYEEKSTPLLVERTQKEKKRKRKIAEDDSDYDPRDDASTPSSTSRSSSQRSKKRKQYFAKKVAKPIPISHSTPVQTLKIVEKKPVVIPITTRKKMNILIPDYEDPLCLPVRAVINDVSDANRLKNWNNACLEHLRNSDSLLKPENGRTVGSTRSIVLRNVTNAKSKKFETNIWSKTCVENDNGVKKSQIFQSVLPKYREKKSLQLHYLSSTRRPQKYHHTDEVILTKESNNDEDSLVVYRPKEATSVVYKFIDKDSKDGESTEESDSKCMREVVCCKICAPCYQASWRGVNKGKEKRCMQCPVCGRSAASVYNLLSHVKTHAAADVRNKRLQLATILKKVVEYHYKCRICQQQFLSVKELRRHVFTHRGKETFMCEIGNHMTM